jgi:hypothetical protein
VHLVGFRSLRFAGRLVSVTQTVVTRLHPPTTLPGARSQAGTRPAQKFAYRGRGSLGH